jgi:hypothetical protein
MQDAHLRLGRLEYTRSSEKTNTHIFLHVDHYMGDGRQAHLLSLFGNDAEVGAITAAIHENHTFNLVFPDGKTQVAGFGKDVSLLSWLTEPTGPETAAAPSHCCVGNASWQWQRRSDVHYELSALHTGSHMGNPGEPGWDSCGSPMGRLCPRGVAATQEDHSPPRHRM